LLDEIVRDGARQMLAAALQASVAAYVEQFVDQVNEHGRRFVVRHGYHHECDVLTGAGAVAVRASRVNDRVDPDTGERLRFPQRSCRRRRCQSRPGCAVRHLRRPRLPILV
jgi:hypothetical protein